MTSDQQGPGGDGDQLPVTIPPQPCWNDENGQAYDIFGPRGSRAEGHLLKTGGFPLVAYGTRVEDLGRTSSAVIRRIRNCKNRDGAVRNFYAVLACGLRGGGKGTPISVENCMKFYRDSKRHSWKIPALESRFAFVKNSKGEEFGIAFSLLKGTSIPVDLVEAMECRPDYVTPAFRTSWYHPTFNPNGGLDNAWIDEDEEIDPANDATIKVTMAASEQDNELVEIDILARTRYFKDDHEPWKTNEEIRARPIYSARELVAIACEEVVRRTFDTELDEISNDSDQSSEDTDGSRKDALSTDDETETKDGSSLESDDNPAPKSVVLSPKPHGNAKEDCRDEKSDVDPDDESNGDGDTESSAELNIPESEFQFDEVVVIDPSLLRYAITTTAQVDDWGWLLVKPPRGTSTEKFLKYRAFHPVRWVPSTNGQSTSPTGCRRLLDGTQRIVGLSEAQARAKHECNAEPSLWKQVSTSINKIHKYVDADKFATWDSNIFVDEVVEKLNAVLDHRLSRSPGAEPDLPTQGNLLAIRYCSPLGMVPGMIAGLCCELKIAHWLQVTPREQPGRKKKTAPQRSMEERLDEAVRELNKSEAKRLAVEKERDELRARLSSISQNNVQKARQQDQMHQLMPANNSGNVQGSDNTAMVAVGSHTNSHLTTLEIDAPSTLPVTVPTGPATDRPASPATLPTKDVNVLPANQPTVDQQDDSDSGQSSSATSSSEDFNVLPANQPTVDQQDDSDSGQSSSATSSSEDFNVLPANQPTVDQQDHGDDGQEHAPVGEGSARSRAPTPRVPRKRKRGAGSDTETDG
ncbi:hypothetical protein VTJ04DRAFT_10423 [Mycothermus thermophilus]|uniref:uncharacterized protein n=1 Tax=Humicola insolens TaxID=85995 RepID=UPI00374347BB